MGSQLKAAFHTALSATETRMLQISTFISYDQRAQQLFYEGKRAVAREGEDQDPFLFFVLINPISLVTGWMMSGIPLLLQMKNNFRLPALKQIVLSLESVASVRSLPRMLIQGKIHLGALEAGTGQGLAIAYSVITDKHHGSLTCESAEGLGASFIIRLPIGGYLTTELLLLKQKKLFAVSLGYYSNIFSYQFSVCSDQLLTTEN